MAKEKSNFIHLHPMDNVVVLVKKPKSDSITFDGCEIMIRENIELGHKVAIKEILPGKKVIKCGISIGTATKLIHAGNHVHLHNLESDYIHTYTLKDSFNE